MKKLTREDMIKIIHRSFKHNHWIDSWTHHKNPEREVLLCFLESNMESLIISEEEKNKIKLEIAAMRI